VGNLADLPFDGQTAITQRGLRGGAGRASCNYIGSASYLPGTDPETFSIGGEELEVRPFAGPKPEFLAMVPWVRADGPRAELEKSAQELSPEGDGPLENDYLETAIVADLPFPPNPARASCATAAAGRATLKPAAAARLRLSVSPRRVRAGRRVRYRFRVITGRGRTARASARTTVRFAGRRVVTNRRGRASITVRLHRTGLVSVRATRAGRRADRATVRVLPAAPGGPRFTG